MLILDTDHFSELMRGSAAGRRLQQRLAGQDTAITIVTLDEQARGWLARIKQAKGAELIDAYARFGLLFSVVGAWRDTGAREGPTS